MGKLIVLINTTTDGFCDSELVTADQEFHEFVQGLLASTQTVAYGRKRIRNGIIQALSKKSIRLK